MSVNELLISVYFSPGLFYPPTNVSLHPTGKAGQILVKWTALTELKNDDMHIERTVQYELRHTSKALQDTVKLVSCKETENMHKAYVFYKKKYFAVTFIIIVVVVGERFQM